MSLGVEWGQNVGLGDFLDFDFVGEFLDFDFVAARDISVSQKHLDIKVKQLKLVYGTLEQNKSSLTSFDTSPVECK